MNNTRALRAFCSICPDSAEVAKFKEGVCLSDGTGQGSSSGYSSGRTISSLTPRLHQTLWALPR